MRNIIRTTILSILYGCICLYTSAQDKITKHEFSVGIGGGLSTLNYSPSSGESKNGMGGGLSLGYTYFLTDKIGLVSGIEYLQYNAKIENLSFTNTLANLTDNTDNEVFDFKTEMNNYEEKQTAHYLNIPLMVQYQTGESNKFYTTIGFKIGIPISGRYKSKGDFINQGFFHESGIWTSTPEFMGFGDFYNKTVENDLDLKIACIASIEAGIKFSLKKDKYLYLGAYLDYGLNNIIDNKQNFINYTTTGNKAEFSNNSILSSYIDENISFTDKVIPISAGLKLRFCYYKF